MKGTKILTQKGYKNVEDVDAHDKLLTHSGGFEAIINSQRKLYTGDLYEISLKYHPLIINATNDFAFYIKERQADKTFTEPIWKKSIDLTYNDFFGMYINNNNIIPEFTSNNKSIKLDKMEYYFILGYFLGNGWLKSNRGQYVIKFDIENINEYEIVDKISKVLQITKSNKIYGCKNPEWVEIFKFFGDKITDKVIPEWIQDIPKPYILEFLYGFGKTNSCNYKNEILEIITLSCNVAYGLQRLYLKLGHIVSIRKIINNTPSKKDKDILIYKDIFIITCNLKPRINNSFIADNYLWVSPVNFNKKEVINTTIYTFNLENTNSCILGNTIVNTH